jgi:predicted GNAT family N-acyltransferase
MIPDNFSVQMIDWSNLADRDACRAVREAVFVVEQKVPMIDEIDELDAVSQHVLARDLDGQPIATGRLVPPQADEPARIGRMAVLKSWRGRHVGDALMFTLLNHAQALRYTHLEMHAQSHAIDFYRRFGFEVYGAEFFECDIAHTHMRRELAAPTPPERSNTLPELTPARNVKVESREQAADETLAVIASARRELCIYSRDLDPTLLGSEAAIEALKHFAIGGRGVGVRILVQDPASAVQRAQRLIVLTQRLPSVFVLRTPAAEDRGYAGAFLLNDGYGYFWRALAGRYEGNAASREPGRHTQLRDYFDAVWERAEASDELRSFSL